MIKKVAKKPHIPRRSEINEEYVPHDLLHALKVAGYIKRPPPMNDWIRKERDGRYHIKRVARGKFVLHFDTYGETCDHYTIPMPYKCHKEKGRIKGIAKNLALSNKK